MDTPEPTLTAPEPAATPQPAPSVEKKPLAQMESWDEYRASLEPEAAPASTAPEDAPETPEATEPPAPALEDFTLDAEGRLHRPDGTFASSDEIEQWNASAPAEPSAEEVIPSPDEPEQPAPEVHTVELRTRDGSTRSIEVDDPELAEILRTNANDGMRASQYRERVAKVDAQLAELNAFETALTTNPDAVIFEMLPEERRASLAIKLAAQYWDVIHPQLVTFEQNDAERVRIAMQTQMDVRTQRDAYQRAIQAQAQAGQIAAAVSALIPDTVEDATADRFLADAEADIARAVQGGTVVTPDRVGEILAHRLKLYGFTNHQSAAAAAPKVAVRFSGSSPAAPPAVPTAKPVGDKAAQLAEQAKAKVQRIQQSQTARQRAAAVPPQGAGAAPVRVPVVPKGASIEDVSKVLKQHKSWASYTG